MFSWYLALWRRDVFGMLDIKKIVSSSGISDIKIGQKSGIVQNEEDIISLLRKKVVNLIDVCDKLNQIY